MQGRTHNCGELRLSNAGEQVRLVGWYENIRKVSKNLGFLILRDFYGTTQIVVETEEKMESFAREAAKITRFQLVISRSFRAK